MLGVLSEALGLTAAAKTEALHDVSPGDRALMLGQLQSIRETVPTQAKSIASALVQSQQRLATAEKQLQQIPDDPAIKPILEKLIDTEREIGAVNGELDRLDTKLRLAEHEQQVAEREQKKAELAYANADSSQVSSEVALRSALLFDEFAGLVEKRRLESVEVEAARFFNRLSRKGELLKRISIDRTDFTVSVTRWDGTKLPKERLSAGEKQLMAISLLWSLARASKRSIPVVVDTPLARLDQEHRKNLLREYFPHVSHQVIVLSTDTEVDLNAAAELAEDTSHRIYLDYVEDSAATTIRDGYFGKTEGAKASAR